MGMSTHVVGVLEVDEKWKSMKVIYDNCKSNNIAIPQEVLDYFDDESPEERRLTRDIPITPWKDDMSEGFELDIRDLQEHVKVIRFYNSW